MPEGVLGDPAQFLKLIEGRKRISRARLGTAEDDLAGDGVKRLRRRRDQRAHRKITLREPRPLIEEPRGFIKRFDVDLRDREPEFGATLERGRVGGRSLVVAKENAGAGPRYADSRSRCERADPPERTRA